jgi:thiamine monophosphate kinase
LCFTANEEHAEQLRAQARTRALDVTWIGELVQGEGIVDAKTGQAYKFKKKGFSHF